MNILVLLAAISLAVYGETCKNLEKQYSDKIEVCKSSEACNYRGVGAYFCVVRPSERK